MASNPMETLLAEYEATKDRLYAITEAARPFTRLTRADLIAAQSSVTYADVQRLQKVLWGSADP